MLLDLRFSTGCWLENDLRPELFLRDKISFQSEVLNY